MWLAFATVKAYILTVGARTFVGKVAGVDRSYDLPEKDVTRYPPRWLSG